MQIPTQTQQRRDALASTKRYLCGLGLGRFSAALAAVGVERPDDLADIDFLPDQLLQEVFHLIHLMLLRDILLQIQQTVQTKNIFFY